MIAARSVTFRAGGRALLRDVSVEVQPGEVLAIVGPNGAGKSTLLRVLSGELRPDQGDVSMDRRPLHALPPIEIARRRAVVSQAVSLAFPLTVREVVALGRLPWHATPAAAKDGAATEAALEAVGALTLAGQRYGTLSGGERQRVQIARALAQLHGAEQPASLLLDEPTASLDIRHVGRLLRLLRSLAAKGMAVMVVLHDLNEAAFVADKVAVIAGGWKVAHGPPRDVLKAGLLESIYGVPFMAGAAALQPDFSRPDAYRLPLAMG
jgi:iron complex transport system ATP-binding protein